MKPVSVALFRSLFFQFPSFSLCYAAAADASSSSSSSSYRRLHISCTHPASPDLTSELLALFSKLSKNPNNPKILSLVDSILTKSHLFDSTSSLVALHGLAQSNKLTRAKDLLSSLKQSEKVPIFFLYSIVFQCLLPRNPIRDVESVWSCIHREYTGNFTEKFVLYACRRFDDASDLESLCSRILSSRWALSRDALVALIGALCLKKNPNPALARDVLNQMMEGALEADDLSYYTVFRSFCAIGDAFGADSVLRNMVQWRNCKLDLLVYEGFLCCLCKAGKFREARKLFVKMSKKDVTHRSSLGANLKPGRRTIFQLSPSNVISETMALEGYFRSLCECGKLEEAESLLQDAKLKCLVLENCVDKSFMGALFSSGRHEEAMRIFSDKRKRGGSLVVDFAATIIACLCNAGRVDDSFELACELASERHVLTAWVWNLILKRYCEDRRAEEAMDIFEGIKLGTLSAFLRPDGSTYEIMIHGLVSMGMMDKAISVFEEMKREKFAANIELYCLFVRNFHMLGRRMQAQEYLNYAIENGTFVSFSQWKVLFKTLTSLPGHDVFQETSQNEFDYSKKTKRRFCLRNFALE